MHVFNVNNFTFFMAMLTPSRAQNRLTGMDIAGLNCMDTNGNAVRFVADPTERENASAFMTEGRPVVAYDPRWLAGYPKHVGLFVLFHECAHHTLGHTLPSEPNLRLDRGAEIEADCWAWHAVVNRYVSFEKWYEGNAFDKIDDVISHVSRNPGGWVHKRGPFRAQDLQRC